MARFENRRHPTLPLAALLVCALAAVLPTTALAQHDGRGHQCKHHGGGHGGGGKNLAAFEVEAVREVSNDWAKARLSVQAEGKQAAEVAAEVNTAMAKALRRAKKARGVEVRSGGYSTHPIYDDGRVVRWRASQELVLESGDTDALSTLIGQLQSESVMLVGIQFGVRRETRQRVEDELITEVLKRFRARASLVAEGLGAKEWSLGDVSVGATGHVPPPIMLRERSKMASLSAAAPAFEGGTSEIRVTASGTVRLD